MIDKERIATLLVRRIYEAYGTPHRLAGADTLGACLEFVTDAVETGDDPVEECRNYISWLQFALRNRKDEHPPQTPSKAAEEINTYVGKALMWSKFKRAKRNALAPRHNPHLKLDESDQPTEDERRDFFEDLKATLGAGATPEIRERYKLNRPKPRPSARFGQICN